MTLAHPQDAIPIWQGEIERLIDVKNNAAYADAVELVVRVGSLMRAAGCEEDFPSYTAKPRLQHKPNWNLMKLFDRKRGRRDP